VCGESYQDARSQSVVLERSLEKYAGGREEEID
jgi:hypothetical protein